MVPPPPLLAMRMFQPTEIQYLLLTSVTLDDQSVNGVNFVGLNSPGNTSFDITA